MCSPKSRLEWCPSMPDVSKRAFDVILSLAFLVLTFPLLLLLAAWVRIDSRGPVLYRGTRVGRGGTLFRMLKFRTMVVDAEKLGASSTPDDDPRLTAAGRILRRYKLDELPQLINVFRGEMSFVGPRPNVQWEVDGYTPEERVLLSVRPGITDWASIKFHNEGAILLASTDPDGDYLRLIAPEKKRLGLEYVRHRSLSTDVRIILQTARVILTRE